MSVEILSGAIQYILKLNSRLLASHAGIEYGWGMRLVDITWMTNEQANYHARWIQYIGEAVYPISIGASKLAILSLYWRLFVVSTNLDRLEDDGGLLSGL